jgi:hypothetical protein
VILTGAFLAQAATVVDNKLDVRGGVLASCQIGPVLTHGQAGDKAPKLEVKLVKPSGDSQSLQGEIPQGAIGGEIGFAVFPLGIQAETNGRYVLEVTSGDSSISLPLTVFS